MLKSKTSKEEREKLRSQLLTGEAIRLIYANSSTALPCCNQNCMQNLIHGGLSVSTTSSKRSQNSSSNNNNCSSTSSGFDSIDYCKQIGVSTDTITSHHPFDRFVEEVRSPFYSLQIGTESVAEANDQLRYYLVQKFTDNRKIDMLNKHNQLYIYQLHSLSRGIITVCKTAYIIVTGVSREAIDYAQRLIRNNKSAESMLLGSSDQSPSETKGGSLKKAFDHFKLDYNLYEQNINHFVDVLKIPDSKEAFMCVAFLAEWFELAGEQEVSYFFVMIFYV